MERKEKSQTLKYLKTNIRDVLWTSIESFVIPGTCDVFYSGFSSKKTRGIGALELKRPDNWPIRKPGNVGLKDHQALFLTKLHESGGISFLLVHTIREDDWLIMPGYKTLVDGKAKLGYLEDFKKEAVFYCRGTPDYKEIRKAVVCW